MFEELNEIRLKWSNNIPITLTDSSSDQHILIIPTLTCNNSNLKYLMENTTGDIKMTLPYSQFMDLNLPTFAAFVGNLSSRYPLLSLLHHDENDNSMEGLSIGERGTTYGNEFGNFAKFLQSVGDVIQERYDMKINLSGFQKYWVQNVQIPGRVRLLCLNQYGLRKSNKIYEVGSTLAKILGYPPSIIFDFIPHSEYQKLVKNNEEISQPVKIIKTKTVIDLWRGIEKVDKSMIEYLQ